MSGGVEVVVFPRIAGVQWSDTVGSKLWEGGERRSRPGYRPWSCEDRAGRPASPCRRRGCRWCMVFYIRRGGIRWALRTRVLHAPAAVGCVAAPGPLVGVRACILGGPGDARRSRTPQGGRSGAPPVRAECPSRKDT